MVYFPFIKAIFFLLPASAFPLLPVSVNMSVGVFLSVFPRFLGLYPTLTLIE